MGWQDAPTIKGGWKAAPEVKPMGKVRSGALGVVDSATFGFADEINAGLKAVGGAVTGKGFKDTYRQELGKNRQTLKNASADNPKTFLAGQIGGAFVPVPGAALVAGSRAGRAAASGVKSLSQGGRASRAAAVAARAAPDVARGAAYGAGSAEGDRISGAAEGAALGAAGNAAGRIAGKAASRVVAGRPKAAATDAYGKAVEHLDKAGVVMTPGRRAGQGLRRSWEETVLGSIPGVNLIPRTANERSVKQLNVAAYNSVLEPLGQKWKGVPPGREAVGKLQGAVYGAYDAAVQPLALQADEGLAEGIQRIKAGSPSVGADPAKVDPIIDRFTTQLQSGPISGDRVKGIIQDLREEASSWARSSTQSERKIGDQLWALHDEFDGALLRQNVGEAVEGFKQAREAVTRLKRVERAAADTKAGIFSPGQLKQAVHARGYGTTTSNLASGDARMQQLADSGALVLPDTVPNSGTPIRGIATLLAGGGMPAVEPISGGIIGATMLPYAPGISNLLQNFALHRPDVLRRVGAGLDRPALGTAGAMGAVASFQE